MFSLKRSDDDVTSEEYELLEMWCDKVKSDKEPAKLSIKVDGVCGLNELRTRPRQNGLVLNFKQLCLYQYSSVRIEETNYIASSITWVAYFADLLYFFFH